MDIDQHAPITASGSVDVSASPGEVWALLADIAQWPTWNPDVREARLDGELQPGSRFVWSSGPGRIRSVLRSVVQARELGWTGSTMGVRAVHVWRIEPTPRGSRVTTEESWSGWTIRFMHRRMEKVLREAVFHGLHNLKTEVEFRSRRDLRLAA
jgi:uncharacterized protein YndB with AHSA1/START domain